MPQALSLGWPTLNVFITAMIGKYIQAGAELGLSLAIWLVAEYSGIKANYIDWKSWDSTPIHFIAVTFTTFMGGWGQGKLWQ